jgi:peptidoglycan/LPS O-acetylase OafA/YrhL
MRAQTCQQRPARLEAVVYRVSLGLPRAKFGPRQVEEQKFFRPALSHQRPLARLRAQEVSMRRSIAAILAIPTLINGLAMLVAGPFWYAHVPGVTETGPFNPHFVQDIGVAFLAAGLALTARAWRPRYWPAAVTGAGFLAAHALIHLVAIIGGHAHHAGFDLLAIVLPAALALYSAFPAPKEYQGEYHA